MKCPFNTIKTIKSVAYITSNSKSLELAKDHKDITVEESFTDCIRYDCPFYRYINSSDSYGNEVIYEQCLRR